MPDGFGMRHSAQFLTRCDLCGTPRKHFYPATIGGINYKFCTGAHLQRAQANYQFKQDNNIKQQPDPEPDFVDNEEGVDFGQSE